MREHPIPQDITNYRFHIVGSMTLKQFGELALGCIVGFLFYSTNLPDLIKWPLVGICVLLGVIAAFIPIAERPLDHWIITYFRNLYNPTLFFWRRENLIPDVFLFELRNDFTDYEPEIDLGPARRERIIEYMRSINNSYITKVDDYTQLEMERMKNITDSFNSVSVPTPLQSQQTHKKIIHRPNLSVHVRKLNPAVSNQMLAISQSKSDILPEEEKPNTQLSSDKSYHRALNADQVAQEVPIPEQEAIAVDKAQQKDAEVITSPQSQQDQVFIAQEKTKNIDVVTSATHFNTSLPFPTRPTEPNKLVGMVLEPNNNLITDAIVEVQTPEGNIVRAVKTNALGQFFITTPLKKGDYIMRVEKSGYDFPTETISVSGKILDPIEIRSIGKVS